MRFLALAACAALLLFTGVAKAEGLSSAETDRLVHGDTVARTQVFERAGRHYIGGITYTLVSARPDQLASLLDDVHGWRRFVPKTREARVVGSADGDELVELTQGSALVHVAYTLRVQRAGDTLRFWLDPSRPHDIEDAWGFLRAESTSTGQTLITYGVLIDVGPGILGTMFEDRVRELALEVPANLRSLLLQLGGRERHASR